MSFRHVILRLLPGLVALIAVTLLPWVVRSTPQPAPKVILISLDGATPPLVDRYILQDPVESQRGLGWLKQHGIMALQNITVTPSLTAPAHMAIATGANPARNNINANRFHWVTSPFEESINGFAAPIGVSDDAIAPTAKPLWVTLREQGRKVVAASFPGADGADVVASNGEVLQSHTARTVDYTVPFGGYGEVGSRGFQLTAADFVPASAAVMTQLAQTKTRSFSPVLQTRKPIDRFILENTLYKLQVAVLDTTDDRAENYDTLVFFDPNQGIQPESTQLPKTGSTVMSVAAESRSFYIEGSAAAGTRFYVTEIAPDLSRIRFARYSVNFLPRPAATQREVDEINRHVGFLMPQPDYRITQRSNPGFEDFSDLELEAMYQDQVQVFVDYQTRVALWAIEQNRDADLVMTYLVQPDGAGHQFLLTDPRQATNPQVPGSIGAGQDLAKVERYETYLKTAYHLANRAVQRLIDAVGTDATGKPNSTILVVSDHGFSPFHTSVSIQNFLDNAGFDPLKVRGVSSGAAVNLYLNLVGREPNGRVSPTEYKRLQQQLISALEAAVDTNPTYADAGVPLFDQIYPRPIPADLTDPAVGRSTTEVIGKDAGDVLAILHEGYNFDGAQRPPVQRLGDVPSPNPALSIPTFYGTHGYDADRPAMSAIFFAAGQLGQGIVPQIHNIDIAPTILNLLGVPPEATMQGRAIELGNLRSDQ